jgi:hypothetical protein
MAMMMVVISVFVDVYVVVIGFAFVINIWLRTTIFTKQSYSLTPCKYITKLYIIPNRDLYMGTTIL